MDVPDTKAKEPEKAKEDATKENPETTPDQPTTQNEFIDDKRLYVMNLSYTVTKEELQELFGKYGEIADIEIPFRKGGRGTPLGIGFVRFQETECAIQAFAELDKSYYQGRKIHIKPAEKKPPKVEADPVVLRSERVRNDEEYAAKQSNYKKEKE